MAGNDIQFRRTIHPACQNRRVKFYDLVFVFGFGFVKKQIPKNDQNCRNFCEKMKFKIGFVAENDFLPEAPVNFPELSCKIV